MSAPREAILALARLLAEQCVEDRIAAHCQGGDSESIEGSNHEKDDSKAPAKRRKSTKKASEGLREVRR